MMEKELRENAFKNEGGVKVFSGNRQFVASRPTQIFREVLQTVANDNGWKHGPSGRNQEHQQWRVWE